VATATQVLNTAGKKRHQRSLVVCHCTTVHQDLKSRTFHRQLLPLAQLGFDVRYIAPIRPHELTSGIKIIGFAAPRSIFQRLAFWPALLKKLLRQKADIYHIQDPQLLPLAFALKLIFRKRVVYDAYEDFPSIAAARNSIPAVLRPFAATTVAFVERLAARAFDAIITADPITMRRLGAVGESKKLVFYNFPNLRFFPAPRTSAPQFDLVYRGGISERTGALVLLEALQLLAARPNPPRLLFIGYFDSARAESEFRERVRALNLDSLLETRGRIDHASMATALSEARMGLCPLLAIPKFQKNIPVKVFEYWACGLPVVATDLLPIQPFLRPGEAGLLVQPGGATELAEAIKWLLDHPDSARRMGQRGRRLVVQRFNNENEVRKLHAFVQRIANPSLGGHSRPCSSPS
jgi:glycosyltransferase involved in cell wall biosynthesis